MRRVRRATARLLASPTGAFCGLVVLPVLHLMFRMKWVQATKLISVLDERLPVPGDVDVERGHSVGDAVFIGARLWRLHESSCVARSICTWAVLRRSRLKADIVVGLDPKTMRAHAWVEVNGEPVDDTPDVSARYLPLDGHLTDRRLT